MAIPLHILISTNGIIFLGIIGAIITLIVLAYYYNTKNKIKRKLKQHPNKAIPLCKENEYVKITGKAFAINEPLLSPFGKSECVYYQIEVEREKSDSEGSTYRKTIFKEEKAQDFIIEANQEKAIVQAYSKASKKLVYLTKEVKYRSGTLNNPPKFVDDYLKSHGKKSTNILGLNKSLRYIEGIIEIDEEVTVMGIGNWKESDHKFDRYSSKNLFISGDKANKLIITDDQKMVDQK